MKDNVKYSIVIPHLNMIKTVEQALDSILIQLTDEFEVIVVDDGSTDGSLARLRNLEERNSHLKLFVESNNNIADAVNSGIEHSNGDYIITHIDADNYILPVLVDFAHFCTTINERSDSPIHIVGQGGEFGPRDLYDQYPYRSLGYGEDKDRWRRLLDDNKLLWYDHVPFSWSIGYDRSILEQVRTEYKTSVTNFRSGIDFVSYLQFYLKRIYLKGSIFHLMISPITRVHAELLGKYDSPEKFKHKENLNKEINNVRKTFDEICGEYNINKSELSFTEISERYLCRYDGHDAPHR